MEVGEMEEFLADFEKMKRLMLGFSAFQTLVAGCKLGLFQRLSETPGIARKELARKLGISEHSTRILLLACCTYELTTRKEGAYFNSSLSEKFLTDKSMFPILTFTKYCNEVNYKAFQFVTESLKGDTNAGLQTVPGTGDSLYKRLAQTPELERCFQDAMAPKDRNSRQLFFDAPEFKQIKKLLDVGGGPGLIAALLKRECPNLQITLFDLPTVCQKAAAHFDLQKLDGLTTNPGDFFTDPMPQGHDAILFSHLLEIFAEDKIVALLKKGYAALPKGGKMIIYGMACDDEETGADMAAWGSLYFLALASGEGMMYPVSDYVRWLKEVGFSSVIERRNAFENMIVVATK
jgi:ubiquinone/menaquinone biosynthesis C-methylase UbiE